MHSAYLNIFINRSFAWEESKAPKFNCAAGGQPRRDRRLKRISSHPCFGALPYIYNNDLRARCQA